MKQRVYIDTSVVGGCEDVEFSEWSRKLFGEFERGEKIAVVSELVLSELENAPDAVKGWLDLLSEDAIEKVYLSDDAKELADAYIKYKVIGRKHILDTMHIALATISRVDVLVSWNFKHIVNLDRIHKYNSVNLRFGYLILEIRTPKEVLSEKEF